MTKNVGKKLVIQKKQTSSEDQKNFWPLKKHDHVLTVVKQGFLPPKIWQRIFWEAEDFVGLFKKILLPHLEVNGTIGRGYHNTPGPVGMSEGTGRKAQKRAHGRRGSRAQEAYCCRLWGRAQRLICVLLEGGCCDTLHWAERDVNKRNNNIQIATFFQKTSFERTKHNLLKCPQNLAI